MFKTFKSFLRASHQPEKAQIKQQHWYHTRSLLSPAIRLLDFKLFLFNILAWCCGLPRGLKVPPLGIMNVLIQFLVYKVKCWWWCYRKKQEATKNTKKDPFSEGRECPFEIPCFGPKCLSMKNLHFRLHTIPAFLLKFSFSTINTQPHMVDVGQTLWLLQINCD